MFSQKGKIEGDTNQPVLDRERRWRARNLVREREERLKKIEHRRSWVKPWLQSFQRAKAFPVEERREEFQSWSKLQITPRSLYGVYYLEASLSAQGRAENRGGEELGTPLGTFSSIQDLIGIASAKLASFSGAQTDQGDDRDIINFKDETTSKRLFEEEARSEEEPVERNMAAPAVPIAVLMGNVGDRTTNVAPLPTFSGWQGSDPDHHISQFLTACIANNGRTEDIWLRWFPATLKDVAFAWYNRQPVGGFENWDLLRQAFLTHFRPTGFEDRLREQLINSRMIPGEAVESYYGRVADVLRKWPNNNLPDNFVLSILVNGLYPPELRMFVKEHRPETVEQSLTRARVWEECHYDPFLPTGPSMIPAQGTPPAPSWMDTVGSYPRTTPQFAGGGVYSPQVTRPMHIPIVPPASAVAYAPYQAVQPQLLDLKVNPQTLAPVNSNETLILNLTKKMEELAVNMAKDKDKRPKQTNFRPNVWCSNCKGQGHMVTECPSPANMQIQCQNCGKNHPTENCWHLARQQVYAKPSIIPTTPWDVNQVQAGPGYNWSNNRSNNQYWNNSGNPQYQGTNSQNWGGDPNMGNAVPTGQPGLFTKPTWNMPSRYIPASVPNIPGGNMQKPIRCF